MIGSDVDSYRISLHKQPPVIVMFLPHILMRPQHLLLAWRALRNLSCAKDLFPMRDRAAAGDRFRGGDYWALFAFM